MPRKSQITDGGLSTFAGNGTTNDRNNYFSVCYRNATETGMFLSFCHSGNVTRDREKSREKPFHREGVICAWDT